MRHVMDDLVRLYDETATTIAASFTVIFAMMAVVTPLLIVLVFITAWPYMYKTGKDSLSALTLFLIVPPVSGRAAGATPTRLGGTSPTRGRSSHPYAGHAAALSEAVFRLYAVGNTKSEDAAAGLTLDDDAGEQKRGLCACRKRAPADAPTSPIETDGFDSADSLSDDELY